MQRLLAPLALMLAAVPAFAQGTATNPVDYQTAHLSKIITAVRASGRIVLDGHLDEPDWQLASPAIDFIQRQPFPGMPSHERTEVRILYDDRNLYVGYTMFDSDPTHMVINGLEQDFSAVQSDSASLVIDSLHDKQNGIEFAANPAGAKYDTQFTNDGAVGNPDWDGVWDVKTSRNSMGWIAEFMIPFKTLRFSKSPSQEWGVNFGRRILRVNEVGSWAPIPTRYTNHRVSIAGTLKGLEGIRQGRNLGIKPYASGGLTQVRGADGRLQTVQALGRIKDQNAGLDLKYSVTPSLTLDATYRTDFAQVEVDQQQVNLTRFNLFFPEKRDFFLENAGTFTFGPGDNLLPFFSRRIGLSAAGTPIPIVGGLRLSGKVNDYDVGVIEMQTESLGSIPSNNYLVGRLRRNLLRSSYVGALVTNRDSSARGDFNRVYGVDAHFQFQGGKLEFDTYLLESDTPRRSGRDQAKRFETAWKDDELTISGEYNTVEPDFNPEVGFVRRTDLAQYLGEVSWKPRLEGNRTIRTLNFGTTVDYNESSSTGRLETRSQEGTLGISFQDGGSITFAAEDTFDRLAAPLRIPSGNPHVTIASGDYEYLGYSLRAGTNSSRNISGSGTFLWGDFYGGDRKGVTGGLTLKPDYHLTADLTYERNQIDLPVGAFTTNLLRTRLTYALTPRLVFRSFIQYNADTHQVSSNVRFNWTYRPLSDIFVVYNETQDTITGLARERTFTVKMTRLFSF